MDSPFVVVPAESWMLPALAAIEAACFAHPWSLSALEGELSRPDARLFCARQGEEIAAYGSMRMVLGEGSIGNLACQPRYRGQGAGGLVLDTLIACGREAGLERMMLEVRPSNAAALSLYRGRGFTVLGRRKGFYRDPAEDALIMELPICSPGC